MNKYEMNIGLEVHVELSTKTKIFCGCSTAFGGKVNSRVCPVCMALPGTLPVLNKKVVDYAIAVGLATNCNITRYMKFDRKNYFYPDNPQNYQISQLYLPICTDGYVEIDVDNDLNLNIKVNDNNEIKASNVNDKINESNVNDKIKECDDNAECNVNNNHESMNNIEDIECNENAKLIKKIGIHEIHMEEDAGKLIHDEENDVSLIDYNRAGVPLIEIVTKPDMSDADEVISFLNKLKLIIQYLGVSDCKLNEGSMRVDVNLSVKEKDSDRLGTRTEMKNLNSFKAIRNAIENERKRQIEILENGHNVTQETRRWDDNKGCSYAMRSKEDSNDYRYFPEPDLMPVMIDEQWISNIRAKQPELRDEKIQRYKEMYTLPDYDIDILTSTKKVADMFENIVSVGVKAKKASNWIMVDIFKIINDKMLDIEDVSLDAKKVAELILLVENRKVTKVVAVEMLEVMFEKDIDPIKYVEENGLMIVENDDILEKVIDEVFQANSQSIIDYQNGKTKAMGYLVGQTMKAMKGKAAPDKVNKIIKDKLDKLV